MAIGTDFSVTAGGNIRHDSGTGTYTVLELHRWLQDLADDASAAGNDVIDITSGTPSERSTDNIITLNSPYNIDDTAAEYFYDGSITQSGGDTVYSGLVVVGSVFGTTTLQVVQDNALYDTATPFWTTGINDVASANILTRMLIKTRDAGADIDGKRIRIFAREWGETYAEFGVTMGLGNSTAAIFTNEDLNNTTAVGTVATWSTITNTEGYGGIDIDGDTTNEYYYSEWNRDSYTINQLYEYAKWLTRRGSAETVYGLSGELFRGITHQFNFDGADGAGGFTQNEIISWGAGSTAGTATLIAADNLVGVSGTMWVQLLSGVVPTDPMTITGGTSSETCELNGSVTSRSLPAVFLGQSTGSSLIGGFGVGVESADVTNADKLFDLTNTQNTPPQNVTFTVYGLISGDRVLVTNDSSGIDETQMTLGLPLAGATETSIVVNAIPTDTPQTGTLRIVLDDGRHRYVAYTSWTVATFTIGSSDWTSPDDAAISQGVYLGYIDKATASTSENFTVVYNADRTLFVRVRDGGGTPIKTFETTGTLNTAGGSTTAIRTSDE